MYLVRHALASALVATALAVAAGVFVFARPHYALEHPTRNLDMTHRQHVTVQQVRSAFARQGIRLDHGGPVSQSEQGGWLVMLSTVPAPVDTTHLQVNVFGPHAKVGWGKGYARYEALFGNVAVTYDGTSGDVLRRAKAAVAELEKS